MGRSQRFARTNFEANMREKRLPETGLERFQYDDLPKLTIGRFVLDKLVHPNYGVRTTIYDYRNDRPRENAKGIVDFTCDIGDIFVPILPPSTMLSVIMNNHPANAKHGLRKTVQEISQAKKRISKALSEAKTRDFHRASEKAVALSELRNNPDFEHYDLSMFDPEANHEILGEITVGLKTQPALLDDVTLGFNIQRDTTYIDGNKQVLHAISEAGYGAGLAHVNVDPMANASVPILNLSAPLSSIRSDGSPNMPPPPNYIQLGPIVMVEIY